MSLAVEGEHVVFAQGEEVDILYDDHLRVVFPEQRICEHLVGIHLIASGQSLHGFGHTHRGLHQPFTIGVFSQQREYLLVVGGQFFKPFPVLWFFCHVSWFMDIEQ